MFGSSYSNIDDIKRSRCFKDRSHHNCKKAAIARANSSVVDNGEAKV